MSEGFDLRKEWLFAGLIISFCVIYVLWYPATIAILDESTIVALAYSILYGSIYLERCGVKLGTAHRRPRGGNAIAVSRGAAVAGDRYELASYLIVTAGFFLAGAFIVRAMLSREGLGSGWTRSIFCWRALCITHRQ